MHPLAHGHGGGTQLLLAGISAGLAVEQQVRHMGVPVASEGLFAAPGRVANARRYTGYHEAPSEKGAVNRVAPVWHTWIVNMFGRHRNESLARPQPNPPTHLNLGWGRNVRESERLRGTGSNGPRGIPSGDVAPINLNSTGS